VIAQLAQHSVQAGFAATPPALPRSSPFGGPPAKQGYERGTVTIVEQGDLRIDIELGVFLRMHIFRGPSPARQVSCWA